MPTRCEPGPHPDFAPPRSRLAGRPGTRDRSPDRGHPASAVPTIGVIDLDAFFPPKDRFALAMRLNNLLAAPGVRRVDAGRAAGVAGCSTPPEGKPRMSIMSIAHLGDAERMFFVSMPAQRAPRLDARPNPAPPACAPSVHGRNLRLLSAGGNPPIQGADADPAVKQARAYGVGWCCDAESGRPRLQRALQHRHVVPRPLADRTRQSPGDGRPGGRSSQPATFDRTEDGANARRAGESRLPDEQRARRRAGVSKLAGPCPTSAAR